MSGVFSWFGRTTESARNWFRSHRTGGLAIIGVSAFLVLASGVGATLAVTGVLSPTDTTPTTAPSASPIASVPGGTGTAPADDPLNSFGGGWSSLQSPGGLGFRWQGRSLDVIWTGACTSGPIEVTVGPQNWGKLSHPIAGIQAVGGAGSTVLCNNSTDMMGTGDEGLAGPGYWKCFNFTEVWILVSGRTPDAGLHKMLIPSSIPRRACPAGASTNDPTRIYDPRQPPPDTAPAPAPAPTPDLTTPSRAPSSSPSASPSTSASVSSGAGQG